jgi:polysaccharide chain length determinant protein (PEP-CTERM system associated)
MNLPELIATVLEHVRGMWRYKWWGMAAAWALSVVGWVTVYALPDVYRASTQVFVDTNSLLRPLMEGLTATSNTMDVVQLVSRAVLTRPNLERVANETNLAQRAATPDAQERLITDLQTRIKVRGSGDNIFTIEYEDVSRDKARDVVAAVLQTFVESARIDKGDDASLTEKALANEIDVHETRLREAENRLAEFKQANVGYMPGENGGYYNNLQATLSRVAETEEKLRLTTERRDELERQIGGEEPVFGIVPTSDTDRCSQGLQIAQLEAQIAGLRVAFTDQHPRVVTLQQTIASLRESCQAEVRVAMAAGRSTQPANPLDTNPVYQNLRIQLSNAEVELAELRSRLTADRAQVERLRHDVDKITQVEAELKQLDRDYQVVQDRHQVLLRRWEDLQASQRLDPVTDQVQFRHIEPPFALADPVAPNRAVMLAAVLVVAVAGGIGLAFGLNQVNPTFFSRVSVGRIVDLPVLGTVAMILTPQARAARRLDAVAWGLVFGTLLVGTALAVTLAPQGSAFLHGLLGVQA